MILILQRRKLSLKEVPLVTLPKSYECHVAEPEFTTWGHLQSPHPDAWITGNRCPHRLQEKSPPPLTRPTLLTSTSARACRRPCQPSHSRPATRVHVHDGAVADSSSRCMAPLLQPRDGRARERKGNMQNPRPRFPKTAPKALSWRSILLIHPPPARPEPRPTAPSCKRVSGQVGRRA